MPWTIDLTASAAKQLRKLGKALQGSQYGDLWRYRVGDYRIVASIDDTTITILVVRIAHRREVYRGLSPLIYLHINPYGRFEVDLNKRIDFELMAA